MEIEGERQEEVARVHEFGARGTEFNVDDDLYSIREEMNYLKELQIAEVKERVAELSERLPVGVPSRIMSLMMQDGPGQRRKKRQLFFFVHHVDGSIMYLYEFLPSYKPEFECSNYTVPARPLYPHAGVLYCSQEVACLGSTIYVVGGHCPRDFCPLGFSPDPISTVVSFDASNPHLGWFLFPPLNYPRLCHQLCTIGGSMYAIGCKRLPGPTQQFPFMEKFDPNTQQWTCLPDPPEQPEIRDLLTVAVPFANYILVGSRRQGKMWAYDVRSGVWLLDRTYHINPELLELCLIPPVAAGMTLFWLISPCFLVGYDLESGKTFSLDLEKAGVLPKRDPACTVYEAHKLLHVGYKQFCLLWSDRRISTSLSYEYEGLNISQFFILLAADGASFEARLVDAQGCIVERPSILARDAFIVELSETSAQGRKRKHMAIDMESSVPSPQG